MEDNKLIKYDGGQLGKVGNAIAVTNKILDLAKAEPLLIPYRKTLQYNYELWGYSDINKNIVLDFLYYEARPFFEGLAAVKFVSNGNYGYIDKTGKIIISPLYGKAFDFIDGIAEVKMGVTTKSIYIDKKGNEVLIAKSAEIDHLYPF